MTVFIGADNSEFLKKMSQTQRALKRGFGSDALEMSSGAAGVLLGIAAAAGIAGAAAIKMSADYTASKTAFTTLLGDAQKAENMLADLATFAADTPFELPGLIKASQKLMAFGFASEDIIPIMSAVGDAISLVGGGQEAIDGVVRALGQIQAKGKLSAEEMNQLAERGINGWKYMADQMGISVAEVMALCQDGAIDSTTAINAVVMGMQNNFKGGMDALSKEIPGLLSTIKDNAGMVLKGIGDSLTESLGLKEMLSELATWLTEFATVAKTAGIKEAIQGMFPPEALAAAAALAGVIVAAAIPAMVAFAASVWAAIVPLAPFIAAGAAIGAVAYEIWNNWEPLTELFGTMWEVITQLFSDACAFISELLGDSTAEATGIVEDGWEAAAQTTDTVWSGICEFINSAWEAIKQIVSDGVNWILEAMQPLLDLIGSSIPDGIKNMFNNLSSGISKVAAAASKLHLGGKDVSGILSGGVNKPNTNFTGLHNQSASSGVGKGSGKGSDKEAKEWEKLEKKAHEVSKQIQKEWIELTGTKIDAVNEWYAGELEKLNESAAANENYERDLQRLNEMYSRKRIKALYEESKERNSIFDSVYESAKSLQERMSKLSLPMMTNSSGGVETSKVASDLQNIQSEYDAAITKIQNKYRDLEGTYEAASDREQAIYLDAWAKSGIAFEVNERGKVNFKKQIDKEMVVSEQEKDQKIRAINVARKQWEEDKESARNSGDISGFIATLSNEQAALAQDLAGRQAYIDEFYALWKEQHKSSLETMAQAMGEFRSGMTDIFMDLGSEIKSFGDFFKSFGELVLRTILKIQAQAAAASITSSLFGNGGWLSGLLGGGGGASALSGNTTLLQSTNAYSSFGSSAAASFFGFATGGLITGPGTPTSDNIPIWVSPGEGILNANAIKMIGAGGLNALNSGKWPRFATGGLVTGPSLASLSASAMSSSGVSAAVKSSAASGSGSPPVTVNVHNYGGAKVQSGDLRYDSQSKSYVLNIIVDALKNNSNVRNATRAVVK